MYTLSPEPKVGDLALNFYGLEDVTILSTNKLQDYNGSKKTETITFVGNAPEGTVSDGFDISGRYCVIANETFFVFSTYNQTKEKPAYDFTSTYFKVPKKLSRVLVRTQKPTYSNKYTYFNLYADGWCEQGGYDESESGLITVSFTVPFSRSPMVFLCPVSEGGGSSATIKINGASAITLETFDMAKTNTGEFWIAYGIV